LKARSVERAHVAFLLGVVRLSAQTSYPLPRPSAKISALLFDELSCEPAIVNAGLKLQQLAGDRGGSLAAWVTELLDRAERSSPAGRVAARCGAGLDGEVQCYRNFESHSKLRGAYLLGSVLSKPLLQTIKSDGR
jgi:hypothetical protein